MFLNSFTNLAKIAGISAVIYGCIWSTVQLGEWTQRKPAIAVQADGSLVLSADQATIQGKGGARLESFAERINIGYWDKLGQSLSWRIDVPKSGIYIVELEYALQGQRSDFVVMVDNVELAASIEGSGGWDKWETQTLGPIQLNQGENQLVTITPTKLHHRSGVMNFVSMKFKK